MIYSYNQLTAVHYWSLMFWPHKASIVPCKFGNSAVFLIIIIAHNICFEKMMVKCHDYNGKNIVVL